MYQGICKHLKILFGMEYENRLLSDALKLELKDLINEVLDERELEKKLNGPYDVFEDGEGEWGTY